MGPQGASHSKPCARSKRFCAAIATPIALCVLYASVLAQSSAVELRQSEFSTGGAISRLGDERLFSLVGPSSPTSSGAAESAGVRSGFLALITPVVPTLLHTSATAIDVASDTARVHVKIGRGWLPTAVSLSFRRGGEATFETRSMSIDPGATTLAYTAQIPPAYISALGVDYFIVATDGLRTARLPSIGVFSPPVRFEDASWPGPLHVGEDGSDYRLISIPFSVDSPSVDSVLSGALGSHDPTNWRLFALRDGEIPYAEYPADAARAFEPGRALFLLAREERSRIAVGPGRTTPGDREFAIPLARGHNFVGSPFAFPLPLTSLRLASGDSVRLSTYADEWVGAQTLEPWGGYYLGVDAEDDTLYISASVSSLEPNQLHSAKASAYAWSVRLAATCGQLKDTNNFAGASAEAADGWDRYDAPEPPPAPGGIELSFVHPEWGRVFTEFSADTRRAGAPNHVFPLRVVVDDAKSSIQISSFGLASLPEATEVVLIDLTTNREYELSSEPSIVYDALSRHDDRSFVLLIGTSEFVAEARNRASAVLTPALTEIAVPNPFRPPTRIRYKLSEDGAVDISVFNTSGQRVRTLVRAPSLPSGTHAALWDGTADDGRALPSGTYLCRVSTPEFRKTLRLVLIR